MFWIIIVAIIVFVILFKNGFFKKATECQVCGTKIKGTKQVFIGPKKVVICKSCASKIHFDIYSYAVENWNYSDVTDYFAWEEETRELRSQFDPDCKYGNTLSIDTERGLFSIKSGGIVLRFADLVNYELNFKPEEVKQGFLGDKVKGNEFVTVELARPNVYLESIIKYGVKLKLRKKGVINTKYEYVLSDGFSEAIRAFTICVYIESAKREGAYRQESQNIGELEKALALFMFDSMDDVTESSLRQQRNALMKAFHPDNNESNEAYSQKINAAYELLSKMAIKQH